MNPAGGIEVAPAFAILPGLTTATYILAPFVPGLSALGADSVGDLLGTGTGLLDEGRARVVASHKDSVLLRVPLPGTPDEAGGPLKGQPRGAGTGWVYLRRYHDAPLGRSLRARFSAPRSASLADRDWNLLCHLRAAGVTTPEPMAVGCEGSGLVARRSFLVTRELPGDGALIDWLRAHPAAGPKQAEDRERRRRVLAALALTLRRIVLACVHLGELQAADLLLLGLEEGTRPEEPEEGCAAERILALQARRAGSDRPDIRSEGASLRWRCLPEVALMGVRGGRILSKPSTRSCLAMFARLAPAGAGVISSKEALVLAARTLRVLLPNRRERHACLRRLAARYSFAAPEVHSAKRANR